MGVPRPKPNANPVGFNKAPIGGGVGVPPTRGNVPPPPMKKKWTWLFFKIYKFIIQSLFLIIFYLIKFPIYTKIF